MHPLHGPEGRGPVVVVRPMPAPLELGERNLERPSLGEDHRPLDEVGQLPHVPGPGIPAKRLALTRAAAPVVRGVPYGGPAGW